MPLSTDRATRLASLAIVLGRTWRFRDVDDPGAPGRFPDDQAIFATWHEYIAGYALLGRGRGLSALASLNRDGEIIARILTRLGFSMVRGSTSRGAGAGYREMLRVVGGGSSICITMDGPRGPRHSCQPGTIRLAAKTGCPIVPMALASTTGVRLRSWDRFLVPAPGARVYAAFGDPIVVAADDDVEAMVRRVEAATMREARRAEAVANEARWRRPYRTRSLRDVPPPSGPGSAVGRRIERRLRAAWTGRTPPDLRLASAAYVTARSVRHKFYDAGVIATFRPPVPVISVGGITVGGSGKTPLASAVAGWLAEGGRTPAIITRGYRDELQLHSVLHPSIPVWGHPDRSALSLRAAADGADVTVLDDGFQHRRLARDFEIVAIDRDALRRTNGAPLPAGPFRDSVRRAVQTADWLVLIGREPRDADVLAWENAWLARESGGVPVAVGSLETAAPSPARPHGSGPDAAPTVALTGIMKPNLFFEFVRRTCASVSLEHALPDHGLPGPEWPRLLRAAGEGGFVMTRKDYVRLEHVIPTEVPVWVVHESLVWHRGHESLMERVLAVRRAGP
ncbi:MAG: tetraacyldisaccharide 4'-kinase [Gemmatimonadota bacterium]|nr:tetraacyldisaccharide 4'-kinase [Gemmatimonadota bacterium]